MERRASPSVDHRRSMVSAKRISTANPKFHLILVLVPSGFQLLVVIDRRARHIRLSNSVGYLQNPGQRTRHRLVCPFTGMVMGLSKEVIYKLGGVKIVGSEIPGVGGYHNGFRSICPDQRSKFAPVPDT